MRWAGIGILLLFLCCKQGPKEPVDEPILWTPYNDSTEVAANQNHALPRMRYQMIQSKVLDKNVVFAPLYREVSKMTEGDYVALRPLILEQDIPTIQSHIKSGMLTYEKLVLFYLYRIYKYELDRTTTLHTVIALNPAVVEEARKLDKLNARSGTQEHHPIYGMPILLKDNINTAAMKTTAGAIALMNNETTDAFIVRQLKLNGALILGKVNLSEWAYFLCEGCPVGYSAIGGQTLNPYGRRVFETGGSSSGSGTAIAANYAVAAVGTETSGSILSPSSKNSVVGLKPTVGLLSRTGIVPISSSLDTPGPMTRNVMDNAIVLSAMTGRDEADAKSVAADKNFLDGMKTDFSLQGKRLGAIKRLLKENPTYRRAIEELRNAGAEVVAFGPPRVLFQDFLSILKADMRNDLPQYLALHANKDFVPISSVADVVRFNAADSVLRIPYGQKLFRAILKDETTVEELRAIKLRLQNEGRHFFDEALNEHRLDAILSIDNYHAGYAAAAAYPALTVPMGYTFEGEPMGLTFIAKQYREDMLLRLGRSFELVTKVRKMPADFSD